MIRCLLAVTADETIPMHSTPADRPRTAPIAPAAKFAAFAPVLPVAALRSRRVAGQCPAAARADAG